METLSRENFDPIYPNYEQSDLDINHQSFLSNVTNHLNQTKSFFSNETADKSYKYDNIEFIFEVLLLGIIGVFGFLGNTLAITMFIRKKDHVNFYRIIVMLIIFDNVLVSCNLMLFVMPHLYFDFQKKI